MPVTCTASSLATESACLTGLSPKEQEAAKIYLLALAASVSPDPETLAAAAACFVDIPPKQQSAIQIYLLCQIANGGSGDPCGTPTATILFTAPSGGYDGTYNQISSTAWEQVTPSADYGFRLVAGVWEVYELLFPLNVVYTTPQSDFPCGVWTQIVAPGPATAAYI